MSQEPCDSDDFLPLPITREIDSLCDEFEAALKQGGEFVLEPYVGRVAAAGRERLIEELALVAFARLQDQGAADPLAVLSAANPALRSSLAQISPNRVQASTVHHDGKTRGSSGGLAVRCPHCHSMIALVVDASLVEIACTSCGGSFSLVNDAEQTCDAPTLTKIAHFELISRLGMGEFGTVWKARDTILDRTVALKIPRREQLDPASSEKFMREARAAAQLRHPNIVSTHEVGRDGDKLYIVSDYVRGVSLADALSDHRLGVRESATMAAKIADALEHAHRSGVVHRDLKPSNILIDDRGEPHLMDFGLAKRKEPGVMVTTEGVILGTPAYMSPEQARGEISRVDGRSDIYSLGVVLYQLLTGSLPFRGSTRMLLQKVISDDPPGLRTLESRVPKDLENVCLKCLEKDPSRRYGAAADLAADLRRYLAGEPVLARSIGRVDRLVRWSRRNRAVASLLGATLAILLAATMVSSYFAWRAANNLYESLLNEIQLTREVRKQGYGDMIRRLVDQARRLPSTRVDDGELRRQLTLAMGDFAAYSPRVIAPGEGGVTALRLGSGQNELFVGRKDGSLSLYDLASGESLAEVGTLGEEVVSIAITERGDELFAAGRAGTIGSWRRSDRNWDVTRSLQLGEAPETIFFSTHGELAAYLKGAQLDIWDVAAGKKLRSLPTKPSWSLRSGVFDLKRERLIAAYVDDQADTVGWALWDLNADERVHELEVESLGGTYSNGIDLTKAGDRLAIGFDLALLAVGMKDYQQTNLSVDDSTLAVAFSPTSPYLAAANIRGSITVWNSATNRPLATLYLPTPTVSRLGLAFSPDGGKLVASNAQSIQVWDLTKADEVTILTGHEGAVPCAAFSPKGQLLASGGKDNKVQFWNPLTGRQIASLSLKEPVQTVAFSPDGRLLAVGCMGRTGDPHLRLVDVETKSVIAEAEPAMGEVLSLAWSEGAEGRFLAGCGSHGVALWRVPERDPMQLESVLELNRSRCLATVFLPDANLLVWAEENHLKAWDVAGNREAPLHAPDMNQGWNGLALLPDGQSIIYTSSKGVGQVWDAVRDQSVASFGAPGALLAPQVALSPNGKWFAALTQPNAVSIWHRPTGKHVFSLRPATAAVWSLAWDPSSNHLAVGQADGGLAVWHLPRIQEKLAESDLSWQDDD